MHTWGDDWEHWDKLYLAINLFQKLIERFKGPVFLTKEKYGSMRIEYFYGLTDLDAWLLRTNRVVYNNPKTRRISEVFDKLFKICYINRLIWKYQVLVFNLVTLYVVKKYPEVHDELLDEYEFNDLLYNWVKKKVNYVCYWR